MRTGNRHTDAAAPPDRSQRTDPEIAATRGNPRTSPVSVSDERFLMGRVALLHEQAPFAIIGSLVCAMVVSVALTGAGDITEVGLWTASFAALSAFRLWMMRQYRQSEPTVEQARKWSRLFVVLSLVAGFWWGYAGIVLVQGQPEQMRMFVYVVIGALCAGSVATYSAVLPAFLAFAAGAVGPLAVEHLFFSTDDISFLVGFLIIVFMLALAAAAIKQSEAIKTTLKIQFDNVGLIEVLETAMDDASALNDSLTAEIRQRERIEQDLARSLALYQATMDAVDEGILALDQDQRIVAVNQRFRELWGLKTQDLKAALDDGEEGCETEELRKAIQAEPEDDCIDGELIELVDGRVFERQVVPCTLDGTVIGRVRTIRDVTARIAAERELRQAKDLAEQSSRAKSEFLAHISHELRTPLNAIIGFSEIYLQEMFGRLSNARYMDYAKDIHDSASLLLSLINDILDLSKIEAGRVDLVDEPISVLKTARQSLRLVKSRAADAGLKLEFSVPMDLPILRCDERALKQMLVNLLANAIKFTPKGGRVALSAEIAPNGEMVISVSDTGVGLSKDQIAQALEPFKQIDNALNRQREGTGLGLPLVKALIEAQGGHLDIVSKPKKGTTTSLLFPADRLQEAIGKAPGSSGDDEFDEPAPARAAGRKA